MANIILRALEPSDIDFLYALENRQDLWHLSHTQLPFSRAVLEHYIDQASQDIYTAKQQRYIIAGAKDLQPLGCVDLFDFDPMHHRAGVGIVVLDNHRQQGIGAEALLQLERYAFDILQLHQLYAHIEADNLASQRLFQQSQYQVVGIKKDWNYHNKAYHDEIIVQKINHV